MHFSIGSIERVEDDFVRGAMETGLTAVSVVSGGISTLFLHADNPKIPMHPIKTNRRRLAWKRFFMKIFSVEIYSETFRLHNSVFLPNIASIDGFSSPDSGVKPC